MAEQRFVAIVRAGTADEQRYRKRAGATRKSERARERNLRSFGIYVGNIFFDIRIRLHGILRTSRLRRRLIEMLEVQRLPDAALSKRAGDLVLRGIQRAVVSYSSIRNFKMECGIVQSRLWDRDAIDVLVETIHFHY